ncbi:AbrB family transcriptional regulator [Erwinia sp. BNK-24-b]|uniref:AbrB family transcriptional regulator n=1 Tax=Erwinia TaxID=551 RepID=UPI001FEEC411|nr:AbrB family transcriptional regulator [Erwinia phyllosphaerae]MBV4366614.1 AbrB family transcriptional regulator [Erwinia phyllosphaerae]
MKIAGLRWTGLILFSALVVIGLEQFHLPAALLLGPMLVAIMFAARDKPLVIPRPLFYLAQGVVGCMIARSMPPTVFSEIASNGLLFAATICSVIIASTLSGWLLTRWQVLPGSTAIWGSSPGAATAMTLMAESYGADVRLVAFMQYMRVVIVAVLATLVARIWTPVTSAAPSSFAIMQPVDWPSFAFTLALILCCVGISRLLRLPAGALLLTLAGGLIAQNMHWLKLELPQALLMVAYAIIGWSIGLRFNRAILAYAAKALPRLLLSIFSLVAVCCGLAFLLVRFAGVDPLTAYLATSPGGADSVAIIAASSHVDLSFVMSMQTGRFIVVLLTGPLLAKWVAKRVHNTAEQKEEGKKPD